MHMSLISLATWMRGDIYSCLFLKKRHSGYNHMIRQHLLKCWHLQKAFRTIEHFIGPCKYWFEYLDYLEYRVDFYRLLYSDCFYFVQLFSSWFVFPDFVHLLPGSFLNFTPSLSHFLGTKSSLMLCQGCRIATWRGEGAGRWIMLLVSAWGPATEHCPRPTSSLNAVDALPYARRYAHFCFPKELSVD